VRISVIYSASRPSEVAVMRALDGRRRRLVLAVGSKMTPREILAKAQPLLTSEEYRELTLALDPPDGVA
jgi:hypothetical protein